MAETDYPRVLIFGPPFNSFSGGGITLTNLFKGWPKDKIAVTSTGHVLFKVSTDVCNTYYLLGNDEQRWRFPFNLLQRSFPSGLMKFENEVSPIPEISLKPGKRKMKFRRFVVDKIFYPVIHWLGLFHSLSEIHLSENFMTWLSEYKPEILQNFVEASLKNLGLETLDLIQLHCPPTEVYYRPEIFELFDKLKQQGKIRNLGVSVEKVEEAIKAINYPNVTTVQIIFNMFRTRPSELFFELARKQNIGVIVRVPLASGLLSGKITPATRFAAGDHRQFNRNGEAFDRGETFSGVDLSAGFKALEQLKQLCPTGTPLAAWAVRWVLMFEAVSCVIPGASTPEQVMENEKASGLPEIPQDTMRKIAEVYEMEIKQLVHHYW